MHLRASLIIATVLAAWGCGGGGDKGGNSPTGPGDTGGQTTVKTKTPDEARRELGTLGVQYDREAFIKAVENGDVLAIGLFIDAGMDPNTKNDSGEPLLVWAAENNKLEVISLLLDKKADINAKDGNGQTALIVATNKGFLEILKVLLKRGADINAQDTSGHTALMVATAGGHIEIVRTLLEQKPNITVQDTIGQTALWYAVGKGDTVVVRLLLDGGADINAKRTSGDTPLALAATNSDTVLVRLLLDKGADVTASAETGRAVLVLAVEQGDAARVRMLLGKGVNPNATERAQGGRSVLVIAVIRGDSEIVQALLGAGADVSAWEGVPLLILGVQNGEAGVVQALLDRGVDIEARSEGRTALWYAADRGDTTLVRVLLNRGADANARDDSGTSLLMLGANKNATWLVRALLNAGANGKDDALWRAAALGNAEVMQILKEAGAEGHVVISISSNLLDNVYSRTVVGDSLRIRFGEKLQGSPGVSSIPAQQSVEFGESWRIPFTDDLVTTSQAVVREGGLSFEVNNTLPVAIDFEVTLDDIKKPDGTTNSFSIQDLSSGGLTTLVFDLSDNTYTPTDPSTLTVSYRAHTYPKDNLIAITSDEGILGTISGQLLFTQIEGRPNRLALSPSYVLQGSTQGQFRERQLAIGFGTTAMDVYITSAVNFSGEVILDLQGTATDGQLVSSARVSGTINRGDYENPVPFHLTFQDEVTDFLSLLPANITVRPTVLIGNGIETGTIEREHWVSVDSVVIQGRF